MRRNSTHERTPLAIKKFHHTYCQIMVVKREKVDRLIAKRSAHPKVSPSRSTAEGHAGDAHKKRDFFVCVGYPTCQSRLADVGQQAKDSIRFSCRQAWEMTIVLKVERLGK